MGNLFISSGGGSREESGFTYTKGLFNGKVKKATMVGDKNKKIRDRGYVEM